MGDLKIVQLSKWAQGPLNESTHRCIHQDLVTLVDQKLNPPQPVIHFNGSNANQTITSPPSEKREHNTVNKYYWDKEGVCTCVWGKLGLGRWEKNNHKKSIFLECCFNAYDYVENATSANFGHQNGSLTVYCINKNVNDCNFSEYDMFAEVLGGSCDNNIYASNLTDYDIKAFTFSFSSRQLLSLLIIVSCLFATKAIK